MFSGADSCANAKKYIVVMSDGVPTHYMQKGKVKGSGFETNGNVNKCSKETVDYVNSLGDDIEIFSVGYEVEVNSNAEKVLMTIASDDKDGQAQYYPAKAASVAEAFENIATSVSTANAAGTEAKLTDYLGAFVQADGVEGKEITKEI